MWKLPFVFIIALMSFFACAGSGDSLRNEFNRGMNTSALAIEGSQTTAELLYKAHQQSVVDAAEKERPLPTQGEVTARLDELRKAWDPLWEAYAQLRITYRRLVDLSKIAGSRSTELSSLSNDLYLQQERIAESLKELRESKESK